jgi:hypothetical protein
MFNPHSMDLPVQTQSESSLSSVISQKPRCLINRRCEATKSQGTHSFRKIRINILQLVQGFRPGPAHDPCSAMPQSFWTQGIAERMTYLNGDTAEQNGLGEPE